MPAPGRLRGRAPEQEHLDALVAEAAAGTGRVVVLEGVAGIGKSALLAHVADRAANAGFAVRTGRGDEMAAGRPFGLLAQALDLRPDSADEAAAAAGELLAGTEALEDHGLLGAGEIGFRILDAVLGIVDALTARQPLLLVVDDAQWADDDSLRALGRLADRAATLPLLVAVSRRTGSSETLTALHAAAAERGWTPMVIGPLDAEAIDDLVGDLVGARPGPALRRVLDRAAGNPFVAIELVAARSADGALDVSHDVAELRDPDQGVGVPEGLRRAHQLGPATVELLQIASVLGRTSTVDEVAGLATGQVDDTILAAVAAGLLERDGDRLSFSHDLVREAAYAELSADRRDRLHLAAAQMLARAGAEPIDVATQVERSHSELDDDAVALLCAGADQVRVSAPATAAAFLRRAGRDVPADRHDALTIRTRLAEALIFSGRRREGQEVAESCLRQPGLLPDQRAELAYLLGQALFLQGRLPEAAVLFERSARSGGPSPAPALADQAVSLLLSGDLTGADRAAETAHRAAREDDDVATEAFVLAAQAWIRALQGRITDALALGRAAVERAGEDLAAHRNVPWVFHAQVLLWADRDEEARAALDRADELGARLGLMWDVPLRHLLRSRALLRSGEWSDARSEVQAGLSHSHDQGGSIADVWLHCVDARLAVGCGELDAAEAALVAAEELAAVSGQGADQVAWARALLAEAGGDLEVADAHLAVLWDGLEAHGLDFYVWDIAPDVTRVAARRGDRTRLDRVVTTLTAIAARSREPVAAIASDRCRGIADAEPDALLSAVATAESTWSDTRPVELALLRTEAAMVLEGAGREREAAGLRALAAGPLEVAGAVVQPLPGTKTAPPRSARATVGWEALTPREVEVLTLLAESLSNGEIAARLGCSRRTVESHLSHAYTKLDVDSRVALALEAASRLGRDP